MHTYLTKFMRNLKLRWKLMVVVLAARHHPHFSCGGVIGYISTRQAYLGITQTSMDDLQHMARFTTDLLNSHYQQFQVYKQDKEQTSIVNWQPWSTWPATWWRSNTGSTSTVSSA